MKIELSEFESEILNRKIAKLLDLSENLDENEIKQIRENISNYDMIIMKVNAKDINLIWQLIDLGFRLTGYPVELKLELKDYQNDLKQQKTNKEVSTNVETRFNIDVMKEMCTNTFIFSHWYSLLSKVDADKIYQKWIENSCNGRADAIFVSRIKEEEAGFLALNIKDNIGIIDLISVKEDFRRKGVGKKLMEKAIEFAKENNLDVLEVRTEMTNLASVNLYSNLGFKISKLFVNLDYRRRNIIRI